jgi:hypothetical protein
LTPTDKPTGRAFDALFIIIFLFMSTQTVQFIQCQEIHHTPNLEHLDFAALIFHPVGENTLDGLPDHFRLILGAPCTDQPGTTFRDFFRNNPSQGTYSIFVNKPRPNFFNVLTKKPEHSITQEYQFILPAKPKTLRIEAPAFTPKNLLPAQKAQQTIRELALKIATEQDLTPEARQRLIDEMARQQAIINELSKPTTFIFGGPANPDLLATDANQQPTQSATVSDSTPPTSPAKTTQRSFAAITAQEPKTSPNSAAADQDLPRATHKPLPEHTITPEDLEQLVEDGLTDKKLLEMGFVQEDINQARKNIEEREALENALIKAAEEEEKRKDRNAAKQERRADQRNAPAEITQVAAAAHEKTRPKPRKPETQQAPSISPEELENLIRAKVSDAELLNPNRGITQEEIDHAKREIARKDAQKEEKARQDAARARKRAEEEKEKRDAAAREKANIEAQARAQEKAKKTDKEKLQELQQAQQLQKNSQNVQGKPGQTNKKPQPPASADSEALTEEKKAAQKKQKEQKAAQKKKEDAEEKWLEKLAAQNAQAANKKTFAATKKITTEADATACIEALKDTETIDRNYLFRLSEILDSRFKPQLRIAAARIILTKECRALPRELEGKKTNTIKKAEQVGQELQDPIIIMETARGQVNKGFTKEAKEGLAQVRKMIDRVASPEQQATLNETLKMVEMLVNVHTVKTTLAIQEGARAFPPAIILSTQEQHENTEATIARIIEYLDGKRLTENRIIRQEVDRTIARLLGTITDPTAQSIIDSYKQGFEAAATESLATLQDQLAAAIAILSGLLKDSPNQQELVQEMATINIPTCLAFYKQIIKFPETHTEGSDNNCTMLNSLAQLLEVIATTQNRLALHNPQLVQALEYFTSATTKADAGLLIMMLMDTSQTMRNSARNILAKDLQTLMMLIENLTTQDDPRKNELACKYFKRLVELEINPIFPDELREPLKETIPTMLALIRKNTYQEAGQRFKKLPQSLQKILEKDFKSFLVLPADTVPTVKHELWKSLFTKALNSYEPGLKKPQANLELFLVTLANTISFGGGAIQNLTPFFTLFGQLIEERKSKHRAQPLNFYIY